MKKDAHLLHGFNVSDGGASTTDTLVPYIKRAGFSVRQHDYGWFGLLQVRFLNNRVAQTVKEATQVGDIGIGHSNGCAILAEAADRGAPFEGLILINPALEQGRIIAPQVKWIHVYHNRDDKPVKLTGWLDYLPWNWGRGHPWGAMGNTGFTGNDDRYLNIDCAKYNVSGHSDVFRKIRTMGPVILNVSLKRLK